jgi:hypothetical protein
MSTPAPHAEFVKTINFSALDSFSYKHNLVTGLEFRDSEEFLLDRLSETTLVAALEARGFTQAAEGEPGDFFVVTKWRKAVSAYANPFDHIDPVNEVLSQRSDRSTNFASRITLILEIYETESGNLFWRNELFNIFEALQLTEERVVLSLQEAIANFPEHIVKDPNLPNIE